MLYYNIHRENTTGIEWIQTKLRGKELLCSNLLNKGTAFTLEERANLGLLGKLPSKVETLEEQLERAYAQFKRYTSDLQKQIYLNNLHDRNETLFYKLISTYVVEILPVVYTPNIGSAVENFSHEFRQPRGLYISFLDQDKIEEILENRTHPEIAVIVVTDGERVLGIGDQGIGAINIAIAKLMLYTMCGRVNPYHTLPIMLDVGTNNPKLLNDPLYLGWKHPRIQGKDYDHFIEKFIQAVQKCLPNAFLHWEDFGKNNARRLLEKYQNRLCTFNDDLQGTAIVAVALILTAIKKLQKKLSEQRVVIFGAGTAGVGIADRIVEGIKREGASEVEACQNIWLFDKEGLITSDMPNLLPFQVRFAKNPHEKAITLEALIGAVKPTLLIGCSGIGGAFSETVVSLMYQHTQHPIILPLSNPTEYSEAHPQDLLKWTEGNALIATGSPFDGSSAQCNNVFSFPGIGLGIIAARAERLTEPMLWAACEALSEFTLNHTPGLLLPSLTQVKEVAYCIAEAVIEAAIDEKVSKIDPKRSTKSLIQDVSWEPYYMEIRASLSSKNV